MRRYVVSDGSVAMSKMHGWLLEQPCSVHVGLSEEIVPTWSTGRCGSCGSQRGHQSITRACRRGTHAPRGKIRADGRYHRRQGAISRSRTHATCVRAGMRQGAIRAEARHHRLDARRACMRHAHGTRPDAATRIGTRADVVHHVGVGRGVVRTAVVAPSVVACMRRPARARRETRRVCDGHCGGQQPTTSACHIGGRACHRRGELPPSWAAL
jgi:hypothetical protein